MATSISSIGVGSGLPLDTLLSDLRKAENVPLAALQSRHTKEQQRFTAYGTLKSALETVSGAAEKLGKGETFNGVKTSVTGDTFTALAKPGSGAIPGNYSIKVQQLASAQVLAAEGVADRKSALLTGTGKADITFTLEDGETHTISIDAANSSLEDVVKAINADSKLGVSATLMNDGQDKPHRLMLSANDTGAEASIKSIGVKTGEGATDLDFSALKSLIAYDALEPESGGGMKQIVAAKNAQLTINNIDVESQSNTIENAIEGVTLTLAKEAGTDGKPDTLRVTRDDAVATTAVTGFVNAYNALQSTIKALTAYDKNNQTGAALMGDSLARRAQAQVRDAISGLSVNGTTLSTIGVTIDPSTGVMSVDNEKLTAALKDNRADIEELFAGEKGLGKAVTSTTELFTKSDGFIKISQDGITETLKVLEQQYEQMEARIDQKMEDYRRQFVQLDAFMAQQNSISSYLTSQLSMLENLSSSGKSKK